MKALIVGAGIGGLTAALCLRRMGWEVALLEQAEQLTEVGAGIQISPNGCHILQALGLMDELAKTAFEPRSLEMRWGISGKTVFDIPLREAAVQRWGAPYLHLHRADLIQALNVALQQQAPAALRTGVTVESYTQAGNAIQAELNTGEIISADLLIGADGIHSPIREQMLGPAKPRFTGNVAWRAVVPMAELGDLAPPPTACVWVGPGRHAVTYRLRGGKFANFVGVVEQSQWQDESWTAQGERREALADYAGWHPTLTRLIEKARAHYRWALYDREPLPRWSDGRAVLLGDACHPMLPFLAQGAVMAIEDAWVLSQMLQRHGDVTTANRAYFAARQARSAKVQAGARRNMRTFHQRFAASYLPVWLVARLMPELLLRRFDWIYQLNLTAPKPGGE